jgi:ribulose-bisphosphate carboxylase small chain
MIDQGYIPAVEFEKDPKPADYHWTMWTLPLFSVSGPQEVLNEVRECRTEYSDCYIRVIAFDNIKQCQTMSFIVHKPNAGRY